MDDNADPGVVVKILQIRHSGAPENPAWNNHSVSIDVPAAHCAITFYSVMQPCTLLQRPQAISVDDLTAELYSKTAQRAVQTAAAAFHQMSSPDHVLNQLPEDELRIADSMSLVKFGKDEAGLLLLAPADSTSMLLPPEDNAGEIDGEDEQQFQTLECSSESPTDQSVAMLSARLAVMRILSLDDSMTKIASPPTHDKEVILMWAEANNGAKVSPSLLLAVSLLMASKEAALFLRMAIGFGFAQVGDYAASLFYLFKRKGHRLKCWECGVKKKAPCGKTERNDLPWCCHRRLGEWLPRLAATVIQGKVTFRENGHFFLGILPPREAMSRGEEEHENPLTAQINYQPRMSEVVHLSDILQERPAHPRQTLRKALQRLAPTCKQLWCENPWISNTVSKIKAGKQLSAVSAHLWLEKHAFFKVPKSLQDETFELHGVQFEDLVEELFPDVEGAPVLGGHNRQAKSPPQPGTYRSSGAAKALLPSISSDYSQDHDLPSSPSFAIQSFDGAQGPGSCLSDAAFVRPRATDLLPKHLGLQSQSSYLSTNVSLSSLDTETDCSIHEEKAMPNTGQGRRRLNARAALRAAGHRDGPAGQSSSLLHGSRLRYSSLSQAGSASHARLRRPDAGHGSRIWSSARRPACKSPSSRFSGSGNEESEATWDEAAPDDSLSFQSSQLFKPSNPHMQGPLRGSPKPQSYRRAPHPTSPCRPPFEQAPSLVTKRDYFHSPGARSPLKRASGYDDDLEQPMRTSPAMPMPLQIVFNGHRVGLRPHWPDVTCQPGLQLVYPEFRQPTLQSPFTSSLGGADSVCRVSLKPKAGIPPKHGWTTSKDPDYEPTELFRKPERACRATIQQAREDSPRSSSMKSHTRKPRTARLQFSSQQAQSQSNCGKRSSSDDEDASLVCHSDLFAPQRMPGPSPSSFRRGAKRICRSRAVDDKPETVRQINCFSPTQELANRGSNFSTFRSSGSAKFSRMHQLLEAVKLAEDCNL